MLNIVIPPNEYYDEEANEFKFTKKQKLQLEHSLVSISKWESKWKKPFLTNDKKSVSESIDYIRCMTITQNIDPLIYNNLTTDNLDEVSRYIADSMTATTFKIDKKQKSKEIITSEMIYYWMVAYNIPFECQKWHLNRLSTLIQICNIKNQPRKKMSRKELLSRNAAMNAARRKSLNTKG